MDGSGLLGGGAVPATPPGADPSVFDRSAAAETSDGARHAAAQLHALTRKNALILLRRRRSTLAYVALPSLAILGLWALEAGVRAWLTGHPGALEDGSGAPLAPLAVRRCRVFDRFGHPVDAPCTTAMFAPATPNTIAIMRNFAAATGLEYGSDVVAAASTRAVADAVAHHPGTVDAAVIFACTDCPTPDSVGSVDAAWGPAGPDDAPALTYELWTNTTGDMSRWLIGDDRHLLDRAAVYGHYEAVTQAVDAAIIGHVGGLQTSADIQLRVGRFAELVDDDATSGRSCVHDANSDCSQPGAIDVMTFLFTDLLLVLGTSFTALMVLYTVASEKDARMLAALRTVGLREWSYWLSWALCFFGLAIPAAFCSTALGSLLGLRIFTQCSFFVQFFAVLLFMQSFAALAIFLASFVSRGRYVVLLSMVLLMVAYISGVVQKGTGVDGHHIKWGPDTNSFVYALFGMMPWFHFLRVESAVTAMLFPGKLDDAHTDPDSVFSWSHLGNASIYQTIDYRYGAVKSVEHPTSTSLWAMLLVSLVYYALAWYLGQVASPDEGSHESCCFCCSPRYWGLRKKRVLVMDEDDTVGVEKSKSLLEQSVRCHKLSKAYKEEMAVSELSMTVESSCCMALLGVNGAGKTTLMRLLTGVVSQTYGEAFIFGLDVRTEVAKLQQIMGVCAQEDLLWPELTAREHLTLYARFKGIAEAEIEQHCTDILTSVGLLADSDNRVSTFSGGMKRRLSVGVASIASPQIMFLDEPSTGMDPLSKRRVWTMIEQLKAGRVMLLTTHSMEEADALGDKIAILDKGRLRACGTSLFLKRTYGKGHTISLLSDPAAVDQVKQLVQASMPSAEILGGDAAGSTSVSVKRSAVRGIPRLFSSLMAEDGLITEWGISDTTLEEVFLRLAAQNHEVNAQIEGGGDDVGRVQIVRQQEVVCVLEAASPSTIVVVEPTDSGLEVVPLPEDADDPMALEDMDEAVNMEQLVLPVSSASEPTTQMVEVVVPPTSQGGQQMEIEIGGQRVAVQLPAGAQPGERVQVPVPLPEVSQSGSDGRTLDDAFANQVSAVGIAKQAYSLLWKNAALAFGCRRAPGFKGCLNCKCCELTFYLSLFIIMALVAIVHTWLVTYMDGQLKAAAAQQACGADPACDDWEEYRGGMYSEFCADGSTNTIFERGHGWLPRDAQAGYAYSGSYCPYTHDGACDEPDVCPWGSDTADCGIVEHHSTQFSSCSRGDVAEEMHNLSKRALLPALGQEHRTWISSCNENVRNAAGASCWADLVRSTSMFLYSYQNGDNCAQRRVNDQEGCTLPDVHSGCAQQNLWNGDIIDFSHGYSDNQCRVWHLTCNSWGDSVTPTLTFTEFDTESGYDWVTVYDGYVHGTRQAATHESYQPDDLLVRASGSDLPAPAVGTRATDSWDSGQLTVTFGSDGSVTRRGFVANFTCSEGLQEPQLDPEQEDAAPALAPELEPEKEDDADDDACLPAAHAWFTDAPAPGSTSLAAMSLFPRKPGLTWSQASGSDESLAGDGLNSQIEYGAYMYAQCRFIRDSECDEPGAGTGLCESGSDYSDCNSVDGVHFTSGIAMQFEAVPAGSVNTRVQEAQRYLRDHTFDTVEAADTFVRDSLPAFAIEVDKSTVRSGAATLHYAVRLWSAHYYNAFAHLRAAVRSPSSGNDTCSSARNSFCSDPTDPNYQYWLHSDQYCDPGTDALLAGAGTAASAVVGCSRERARAASSALADIAAGSRC